jgi:hypothetical protein
VRCRPWLVPITQNHQAASLPHCMLQFGQLLQLQWKPHQQLTTLATALSNRRTILHAHNCLMLTTPPALLIACRLDLLPNPALAIITRKAGRHTRRTCKPLRDAYPLDCGICLDGVATAADITSLLTLNPQRFSHITALQLTAPPDSTAYSAGLLKAVARSFPQLGNLRFSSWPATRGKHLAHLSLLAPCLTALTLPARIGGSPQVVAASLLKLTALHTLSLPGAFGGNASEVARLSGLKQLQHLDLQHHGEGYGLAADSFLPALRALSGLTGLAISPPLQFNLDPAALDVLRTSLPRLSALTLIATTMPRSALAGNAPRPEAEVIAALGHRTALTRLALGIPARGHGLELRALSSLRQLGRLCAGGRWLVDNLLPDRPPGLTLCGATALTALHLTGHWSPSIHDVVTLPSNLARVADTLKVLHLTLAWLPASYFQEHAESWRQLAELRLVDVALDCLGSSCENHGIHLGKLSNLEVLEVSNSFDAQVRLERIHDLPQLTRLRDLTLGFCELSEWAGAIGDEDIWTCLLPLRHSLTRVQLRGFLDENHDSGIEGRGLQVVGMLSCLKELRLCNLEVLTSPQLHEYLLPLPASLRRLQLQCDDELPAEPLAAVQAAANRQDCAVRVGGLAGVNEDGPDCSERKLGGYYCSQRWTKRLPNILWHW